MTNQGDAKTAAYYTKTYQDSPEKVQGLDWGSEHSQKLRFEVLVEGTRERNEKDSVLDVGCGYGDISQLITWTTRYRGIDMVSDMIETAKKRYPGKNFEVASLLHEKDTYDWVFASGPFNVKCGDNKQYLELAIQNMWKICRKGVLFNILVKGPHGVRNKDMHFYDAAEVLAYCRSLTPFVACRMDYLAHDATYYLYSKPRA